MAIRILAPSSASSLTAAPSRYFGTARIGLGRILLLLVAAFICMGGVVINERSIQRLDRFQSVVFDGLAVDVSTSVADADHSSTTTNNNNNIQNTNRTVVPFEKQDGVVIVTKIHGMHQFLLLEQSICLLHFAYNRRPLYDIVVFTAEPLPEESVSYMKQLVHPALLTVVVDNRGLQEEIAALSKPRYDAFLKSCGVQSPVNLTWWSNCPGRLAYNWQAEFRAWHIWRHPALRDYSIMMWLDSDGFCTYEWPVDPIKVMIENDLVIYFDNWPQGGHAGENVQERIFEAFQVNLCHLGLVNGHLEAKLSNTSGACKYSRIGDIHGFFHITNLDFYRSAPVQKFAETWIGNGFLQRHYDDQAGVTIPAAVLAPERSWYMRHDQPPLGVYHNSDIDGSRGNRVGGFLKYWADTVKHQLPEADGVCQIKAGN